LLAAVPLRASFQGLVNRRRRDERRRRELNLEAWSSAIKAVASPAPTARSAAAARTPNAETGWRDRIARRPRPEPRPRPLYELARRRSFESIVEQVNRAGAVRQKLTRMRNSKDVLVPGGRLTRVRDVGEVEDGSARRGVHQGRQAGFTWPAGAWARSRFSSLSLRPAVRGEARGVSR